ncbi:MAG: hypothetical protein JWM97_3081 [Phycisphaerales bacterium]|nr:hypothetical protein [Phycisphaerales bacterium]
MPHFPKPFFRPARGVWYVQLHGKQLNLGPDRDAAFKRYHELMAEPTPPAPAAVASDGVVVLCERYLDWCEQHRAPDTYRWYRDRLDDFCNAIPCDLTAGQLKPHHVQTWVDAHKTLSTGSKRNLCRAVVRSMHWAEEQGYIARTPLAHFKKPAAGKKKPGITEAEYAALLGCFKDQDFKDLLTVSWDTGCRPQESLRVEARHVDVPNARWVFPASEAKGGREPRVVYLPAKALEITLRRMKQFPTGKLFRNKRGRAWTPDACNCRFKTAKTKLGVRHCLTKIRKGWSTRKLMAGVDALTVATLMGHSDTATLTKHYQHLSQNPQFLGEQARRASA